jgi:hypothetical protein
LRIVLTFVVVGGWGFIISSGILMIEVQERWYIPKIFDVGWQGVSRFAEKSVIIVRPQGLAWRNIPSYA